MSKYLYGAAVQGIQGFIFQTNKLKDIIGASELINNICTKTFQEVANVDDYSKNGNWILAAAGNIKYSFDNQTDCEKVVREFPKVVVKMAPGITISQAVVEYNDEDSFQDTVQKLETKLRAQRNKPMRPNTLGFMGFLRSRQTGLPTVEIHEDEYWDAATKQKRDFAGEEQRSSICDAAFGEAVNATRFPFDVSDIANNKSWLAVIHADGNGLGQVVQKIGSDRKRLKDFSQNLDKSTKKSAKEAYEYIYDHIIKNELKENEKIPVRPIVLGGDDFTVICKADYAIPYVTEYMRKFEENTTSLFKSDEADVAFTNLTACAGIAFIKANYPFYYGYELAEALCGAAKKVAKSDKMQPNRNNMPPSCLMFHKVQDSFVESFADICKRELTPQENRSFNFGPYFLKETLQNKKDYWTVDTLLANVDKLKEKNNLKSALRKWATNLHDSTEYANQVLNNTKRIYREDKEIIEKLTSDVKKDKKTTYYPAYDVLSLASLKNE